MTKSNLGNIQYNSSKLNKTVINPSEPALNLGISRNDKKSDRELTKSNIVYTENTYRDYNKEEEKEIFSKKDSQEFKPSNSLIKEIKNLYKCSDKAFQKALDEFREYYSKYPPKDWDHSFEKWCRKRKIWEYKEGKPELSLKENKVPTKSLDERQGEEREIMLSLLKEFGEPIFKSWLLHLELLDSNNECMRFKVPSNFIKGWIEENYLADIMHIINRKVEIIYVKD